MTNKKHRISIIAYGGTIAQHADENGVLRPPQDAAEFKDHCMTVLQSFTPQVEFDFKVPALIDSADTRCQHWQHIIQMLYHAQHEADALIVLFGTDTLAYVANAIQLVTPMNFYQPILLTGAQQPLSTPGSDGVKNLIDAVKGAIELINIGNQGQHLTGCIVAFGERYLNGATVSKVSARKSRGFDAPLMPNAPEGLKNKPGIIGASDASGVSIDPALYSPYLILSEQAYQQKKQQIQATPWPVYNQFSIWAPVDPLQPGTETIGPSVACIDFSPNAHPIQLKALCQCEQIVMVCIRGVGDGNLGNHWLDEIERSVEAGITVFAHSPFFDGQAGLIKYGTAADAEARGAIPTFGMTHSMLYLKALWLLATQQVQDRPSFIRHMLTNHVDEIFITQQHRLRIEAVIEHIAQHSPVDRIQQQLPNVERVQKHWQSLMKNQDVQQKLGFIAG